MIKKILSAFLGIIMLTTSAYASLSVIPYDVENDIMQVSSEANAGERLTVLITNPGFDMEDAVNGVEGAVQYYDTYIPSDREFSFPVQITGANGGEFNIYIKSKNINESASFVFYNSNFKKQCIDDINDAGENDDITEYFENLISSYGMESDEIYAALGSGKCAEAFLNLRNSLPDKKLPEDIGEVMELIEKSFVLAAFSEGTEKFCFENGQLNYTQMLDLAGSDELNDYYESIGPEAKDEFIDDFLGRDYKSLEEINKRFCELVYINVLTNYIESGYGHVHGYFEKYEDAYEDAGFNIPSKENKTKYTKLTKLEADTLSDLAKKFNKLSDSEESKGSSGGGGGSKGSSGGNYSVVGSEGFVNPEALNNSGENETPDEAPAVKALFTDVPESHWAYDSISHLADEGYVNGYADGSFCPDNMITRAEFVKIIAEVFGFEPSDALPFADVNKDAWYAICVAACFERGIITGDGTGFNPDSNITREDAAVILSRLLEKEADSVADFIDSEEISGYANKAVALLCAEQIINGYEDGTFRPKNPITRAEASKMIYKMQNEGGITG